MPDKKRWIQFTAWFLAFIVLFSCVFLIQTYIDRSFDRDREERLLYLPSGHYLKPASLGFDSLIADLLWIKAIGYFGGHYLTDRSYKWLYHILDLVTTLDPHFKYPYEFGGVILALEGGNPDQSTALLQKGTQYFPEYWRLHFYLGFNYFYYHKDLKQASYYITKAAQLPGRPAYLPKLAASLLAQSGEEESALAFLRQLYKSTEDEWLKEQIRKKMEALLEGKLPETLKKLFSE